MIKNNTDNRKPKIIRACTVSLSVGFVSGMLDDLKRQYDVVLLSSPGKEMDDAVAEHGVKAIAVPMQRHISIRHDIVSLWRIVRAFLREKPTMVHSMTPKAGLLCMVAAWMCRVPVRIHTFTGLVFPTSHGLKKKLLMLTDAITCRCATHIIPEGEGVKNDLLSNGITRKPLQVLGYGNVMGIDVQRFSRRKEIEEAASEIRDNSVFTYLFVGRIVGDKGINELVSAFVRLNRTHPNTRLLLVGFFENELDPVSPETRRLIEECEQIEYAGEQKGDNLVAYYAASDCFVFPSYREGFPNTVIEAGAMDLPCIVTDINGSREIIEHGKNGIIIPVRDEQAIYQSMEQMLTDEQMRKGMTEKAREMIVSRYERGFVRQCLYDFYNKII
ncbi:MAG: glycosyltransferase family 4 protein [Prevotella sp.]|nr:glycosyltransferase family 4 protein [Prevotella sp.]MBQ9670135.1 glycosyltransferase family 4 protein [Prevotella sp.]